MKFPVMRPTPRGVELILKHRVLVYGPGIGCRNGHSCHFQAGIAVADRDGINRERIDVDDADCFGLSHGCGLYGRGSNLTVLRKYLDQRLYLINTLTREARPGKYDRTALPEVWLGLADAIIGGVILAHCD